MPDVSDVNQVNPIDLFVSEKISRKQLFYTLICGALVTLIAFRLSDLTKEWSLMIGDMLSIYLGKRERSRAVTMGIDMLSTILLVEIFTTIAKLL
jgi:hypothetical protein